MARCLEAHRPGRAGAGAAAGDEVDLYALCLLAPRRQAEVGERAVAEGARAPLASYGIMV